MGSTSHSGAAAYAPETPLDLRTIFSHPEGLATARSLVRDLVHQNEKYTTTGRPHTYLPFSQTISDMNPTMPAAVQELLAFRDPQAHSLDLPAGGSNLAAQIQDGGAEDSNTSRIHLSPIAAAVENFDYRQDNFEANPTIASQHNTNFSYNTSLSRKAQPTQAPSFTAINRSPSSLQSTRLNLLSHRSDSDGKSFTKHGTSLDSRSHKTLPPLSQLERPSSSLNFPQSLPSVSPTLTDHNSHLPTIMRSNPNSRHLLQPLQARDANQSMSMSSPFSSTNSMVQGSAHTGSYTGSFQQPSCATNSLNGLSTTYPNIPQYLPFTSQSTSTTGLSSFTKDRYYSLNNTKNGNNSNTSRTYVPIKSRTPEPTSSTTLQTTPQLAKMASKKRKSDSVGKPSVKKQKTSKEPRPKRAVKPKVKIEKEKIGAAKVDDNIWMRILEFTPPSFLGKVRHVSQRFKGMVDSKTSIYANCRKENFGFDMPPPPKGLTERQYSNLLGGKGCLAPLCDDKLSSRTYWPWAKRWCLRCWKSKIEREDRVIKGRANKYGRTTLDRMLECLPFGMHDSFMKPHDIMEAVASRGRAPRLYKYYLMEDVEAMVADFEALAPAPFVEDPTHTAEQKAAALADHQKLMDGLEAKRTAFFAERKLKNVEHMDQVKKIEGGIRKKRDEDSKPYNANRQARKDLFTRRAIEEIGYISTEFVQGTVAFKAATRIFRDGGTERGWQTLKPKIVAEWKLAKADGWVYTDIDVNRPSQPASPFGSGDSDDVEMSDFEEDVGDNHLSNLPPANHGLPTNDGLLSQSLREQSGQIQVPQQAAETGVASNSSMRRNPPMTLSSQRYASFTPANNVNIPTIRSSATLGRPSMPSDNQFGLNVAYASAAGPSHYGSMHTNNMTSAQPQASRMAISSLIQQAPSRNLYNNYNS